ncbi:MAG: PfkB family carbohydrate kinase [Candidatus Brocadiia bacterium]
MASELVSIGLSVIDYLFLCEQPREGTFGPASDHLVQGGGLAATAAVAMARLGGRVEMWSLVGEGFAGRFILDQFRAEGVDTSQVRVCPGGRSPACAVVVDRPKAERYFTFFPGRGLDRSIAHLDLSRIERAKAILVDGWWPEAQLAAARRARDCRVAVCGDFERISDATRQLAALTDYPIYCQEAVLAYADTESPEEALRAVAELGGAVPMVTLGEQGCLWLEGGRVHRCPAFPVEVVDTTGCGDVFHGAFAFGLARGWDVGRIARFASATAALKCRALGGRTAIPTYDHVVALLQRNP